MGSFVAISFGETVAGPLAIYFGGRNVHLVSAMVVVIATIAASMVPAIRLLDNSS